MCLKKPTGTPGCLSEFPNTAFETVLEFPNIAVETVLEFSNTAVETVPAFILSRKIVECFQFPHLSPLGN